MGKRVFDIMTGLDTPLNCPNKIIRKEMKGEMVSIGLQEYSSKILDSLAKHKTLDYTSLLYELKKDNDEISNGYLIYVLKYLKRTGKIAKGDDGWHIHSSLEQDSPLQDAILEQLLLLREKVDWLEAELKERTYPQLIVGSELKDILSLPSHLQKTVQTLQSLKRATAQQVGDVTKRARAVESMYLNQLVREGWIASERVGRNKMFFIGGE